MVTAYDAKECTINVNNVIITGLGEDMVTGTKDEDYFSTSVGAQGDVVACVINNPIGQIDITIQPTSPQRAYLDSLPSGKDDFYPCWVENTKLKEKFGGAKCRIITSPERSRGAEAGDMTYSLKVFDYTVQNTKSTETTKETTE